MTNLVQCLATHEEGGLEGAIYGISTFVCGPTGEKVGCLGVGGSVT